MPAAAAGLSPRHLSLRHHTPDGDRIANHEKLNHELCQVASFDEPIANVGGYHAVSGMNEVLKVSRRFYTKYLNSVEAVRDYATEAGPPMMIKLGIAFDGYVNRKRNEIHKTYGRDKEGENAAVVNLMTKVEPVRMKLEELAPFYDLPLSARIITLELTGKQLAAAGLAEMAVEQLNKQLR